MPQLGETVTEGTVTRWLKFEGDHVARDEPLLEVSTDKVDTEIPSAAEGTLSKVVVAAGATVPVGGLLAVITTEDEPHSSDEHHGAPATVRDRSFRSVMTFGTGVTVARTEVPSTPGWPAGLPGVAATAGTPKSPSAVGSPSIPASADVMAPNGPIDHSNVVDRVEFSAIRRLTAQHLTASQRTAAHTLVAVEVDYTAIDEVRRGIREHWREQEGFTLSYLPFVARAVCEALATHPRMNAAVDGDALAVFGHVNLGLAVDLDHEGLLVPVLRRADELRLPELARGLYQLAAAARERRLSSDDLAGGTFTLTNAGGYGTLLTGPIINPPQVGILSTDGVGPRPVAVPLPDGGHGVAVHPVGNLSLSFDHRGVDGAYASSFLAELRSLLERTDWRAELTGAWR